MQQQSYTHLKSMLWASPASRVYAVISGAAVPGLREKLAKADVRGWDCLWRGALPPEKASVAPYVVELTPDGEFTTWLLRDAAAAFPQWGLLAVGPLALMAMREHGRRLSEVTLPEGPKRRWTWYAPELWMGLLPRLEPTQLDAVYGVLTDWVVISPKVWHWMTLSAGQLVQSPRECLNTPAS